MIGAPNKEVDDGVLWDELPDAVDVLTLGPVRRPPYAHDPAVDSRLPVSATVGQHPDIHTARHGSPAEVQPWATQAVQWTTKPGDVYVRPAESSEALAWREPVRVRGPIDTSTIRQIPAGIVFELGRVELPEWRLAYVERLATYVRLVALDAQGDPIDGSEFVTTADGSYDPFPDFIHPVTQSPLTLRWSLLGLDQSDPGFDGLTGHNLPSTGVQIQPHWSDLRYGWGQVYSEGLQLVCSSGTTSVRLYATITAPADSRWRITLAGRLGVVWVGGGPHQAALDTAIHRVGS